MSSIGSALQLPASPGEAELDVDFLGDENVSKKRKHGLIWIEVEKITDLEQRINEPSDFVGISKDNIKCQHLQKVRKAISHASKTETHNYACITKGCDFQKRYVFSKLETIVEEKSNEDFEEVVV